MTSTLKFVQGSRKNIEFQLLTIDPDTPHVPEAINLTDYDEVHFKAKQIGPPPYNPTTFTPKTIDITGVFIVPHDQGYVSFDFTPTILNTPGLYECRIELIKAGTEDWYNKYDFRMDIRESF